MEIIEIIPRFFYKSLIGLRGVYFKKETIIIIEI